VGYCTNAKGSYSTALGNSTIANGSSSTALSYRTTASGSSSTAIGYNSTASGDYSTALGNYVSTNSCNGSFIIGDYSTITTTTSSAFHQMTMRFAGGYKLYSNSTLTTGSQLAPGGNSWSSISDSTKKENFIKADGEYFLNSLSALKLRSWNYKGQNPETFRHYGPMAQEIFKYFGQDGLGTIGCDTLLASADVNGRWSCSRIWKKGLLN
jgi:hypothetical protein